MGGLSVVVEDEGLMIINKDLAKIKKEQVRTEKEKAW
jgi:hypothetical protein